TGAESVGPRPEFRWFVGRIGGSRVGGAVLRGAGDGHRRIDPDAGVVLWVRGLKADLWAGVDSRNHSAVAIVGSLRAARAERGGRSDGAQRTGGVRQAGHREH